MNSDEIPNQAATPDFQPHEVQKPPSPSFFEEKPSDVAENLRKEAEMFDYQPESPQKQSPMEVETPEELPKQESIKPEPV